MRKSFGNLDNNIIALINVILAIVFPALGLVMSFVVLVLETEDSFVRYYAKNMIVASIVQMILRFIINIHIYFLIGYLIEAIFLIYTVILIIACVKAYKLEIWRIPVITDLMEKLNI